MARHATSELRRVPVFETLSKRQLERVDSLLTPISFRDGDVLCHEGRLGREAFVILSGEVEVSRGANHLATLGAGALVGEQALLGEGRRNATVTAAGDVTALVMSTQEFASVLAEPSVAIAVQRVSEERTGTLVAA
jgi:CRP/FNR family transcriptional regulator, cyclic AMP receptor protein